jgi:hypothetical protein
MLFVAWGFRNDGLVTLLDGQSGWCIVGALITSGGDMKIWLRGAAVVLLGCITTSEPLLACGEKFLMRSRGTRFQRPAPARTAASILVYLNPSLNLPKALAKVPVDATLSKVGYRLTTVTGQDEFTRALDRGGWDLVVVDVADTPAVTTRAQSADSINVLPVAFNPTRDELAAARTQHGRILKGPVKSQAFLEAVDDALAAKPTTVAKADINRSR